MNGEIAQIVALACHGNASLQGDQLPKFFPGNSTFRFCDRVTFVETSKRLLGGPEVNMIAQTPEEWFALLRSGGARGIRLARAPQDGLQFADRMSSAFIGGGGTWSMQVLLRDGRSESWTARWDVWDRDAPEQRIWRVTYGRLSEPVTASLANGDLATVERGFLDALREIHTFSVSHGGVFAGSFANSIASLTGSDRHGYHQDLAPPGLLGARAAAILDACQAAWVFGGMGSWNDLVFDGEDDREYRRVSEQLFASLTVAICAAVNSAAERAR
jgi:hypothetical protein